MLLTSVQIATRLRDLLDHHDLWDEVAQLRPGRDRAFLEAIIAGGRFTTTELHDFCYGLAIDECALVDGEEVVPAPTPWQRDLDRHGVKYHLSYLHKDKPDEPLWIEKVKLELEPEEWCALCMYEGDYYIGPCCGNSSAQQDIVNAVFRNDGWMDPSDLRSLAELGLAHDGEQSSQYCDPELLTRWADRIDPLTPWERLGCLWQLTRDHLAAHWIDDLPLRGKRPRPPEADAADALYGLLTRYRFSCFFEHSDNDETGQHLAVYLLEQAKFLAALKVLHQHYTTLGVDPFEGYAIQAVESGEVAVNGYGACIYRTKVKGEEVLELWSRESARYNPGSHKVVPCRITLENGLEWMSPPV